MPIQLNYQSAALRVCVDSTADNRICGRIVGQRISEPILFSDITDFLIQVDALLDVQRFPQAFQRIRSFTDKALPEVPAVLVKEELGDPSDVNATYGQEATFLLQISTRKNASWQGFIDWIDGAGRQTFCSTLEFLKLVDNGLQK